MHLPEGGGSVGEGCSGGPSTVSPDPPHPQAESSTCRIAAVHAHAGQHANGQEAGERGQAAELPNTGSSAGPGVGVAQTAARHGDGVGHTAVTPERGAQGRGVGCSPRSPASVP